MTTIKNEEKEKQKKKLKRLIGFLSANKIDNNNGGGGGRKKKSKSSYRTSQKIRIINAFLESLLSELGITVHLTSLGCPPTLC